MSTGRLHGTLRILAALTGVVLLVIGIRFLIVPHQASRFFGITAAVAPGSADLHYVIGFRDIWLAAIVIVLSALKDWRGLAIWMGLGALVCMGDAAIAAQSSAKVFPVAFHLASGLFCAALAAVCLRQHSAGAG